MKYLARYGETICYDVFDEPPESDYVAVEVFADITKPWYLDKTTEPWSIKQADVLAIVKQRTKLEIDLYMDIPDTTNSYVAHEHLAVYEEACAFLDTGQLGPLLKATIDAGYSATPTEAALDIKSKGDELKQQIAELRLIRLTAKLRVTNAVSEEEVNSIYADFKNQIIARS